MIQGINSAFTGLLAQSKKLDTTAENLSNINTNKYKEKNLAFEEGKNGEISTKIQTNESQGPLILEEETEGQHLVEKSNVDMAKQMINLIESGRAFEANIKTIQSEDELIGTLLDIVK